MQTRLRRASPAGVILWAVASCAFLAGRAEAGIIISSTEELNYRASFSSLADPSDLFFDTDADLVGASSYADSSLQTAASLSGTASGFNVSLMSAASIASDLAVADDAFVSTFGRVVYTVNFTVDAAGTYDIAATFSTDAMSAGTGEGDSTAFVFLYDLTDEVFLALGRYTNSNTGVVEFLDLPSQVTFVVGHDYQWGAETSSTASLFSASGSLAGSASGRGSISATMTLAVPEPSSLALCGIAGFAGLGYRRLMRKPPAA